MSSTNQPSDASSELDVAQLSYEVAKQELASIVQQLESGSAPLEQTLQLWRRGEELAGRCRFILESASAQINAASGSALSSESPF